MNPVGLAFAVLLLAGCITRDRVLHDRTTDPQWVPVDAPADVLTSEELRFLGLRREAVVAAAPVRVASRRILVDHDGASDDFVALSFVLTAPEVAVGAITITPADSIRESAIEGTLGMLRLFGKSGIPVAAGTNVGVNPFPLEWRQESVQVAGMPELKTPWADWKTLGFRTAKPAQLLVDLLTGNERYEVLATGPLTNVADALRMKPSIAKNITRIVFMGGALAVPGNVSQDGRKPVAEWNVYNNPGALRTVLAAKIPMLLVPLDGTNKAPVTTKFLAQLAGQRSFKTSDVFARIWDAVHGQIEHSDPQRRYYLWDSLAAAVMLDPKIGTIERRRVSVVVEKGPEEGRVRLDPEGTEVDVVVDADSRALDKRLLEALAPRSDWK